MSKFSKALRKCTRGTAVTEWIVAASIMAVAGIALFNTVGQNAGDIMDVVNTEVGNLAGQVEGAGGTGG